MDFQLDFEQRMVQESTQKMVERDIAPILAAHDPDTPLPKSAMQQIFLTCASVGLTGARIPESAGGSEMSALTMGLMYEQLPPAIGLSVIAHEGTGARLHHASTPAQRERILPDLISGKKIACTGVSEPGVGSDPRSIKTRAVEDGDHYVIEGRKIWITNASICDVINVTCTVGKDDKGLSRMMRVMVDRQASPFTTREIEVLGLKQGHLSEVLFENCRAPKSDALGEAGDAAKVLTLTWLANRPIFGLFCVHLAQKALDAASQYAKDRVQFGRQIGSFQLVQHLLADISTAVTTSRLLCYYALNCIDNGDRANHVSAMAKRYAVQACQRAVSMAMEVHGAMGLTKEMGIEQLYRDVRMFTVPDGTNQILALIEGRELTEIAAFRP
ncbi:acyl-CoA dehydrogenase family protein [Bordetella sp. BOR01]|uniref:acyl-CoA dehydrogenase family protein n=1 Tax=Bordetella sp. BOR01 TaxID=2854779 RepID=UPI001C484989|nr:acyl-CoA dehydrogenase family protein [Bordetella sp. BOR01]MBV7483188.1 acyl-CoA/acyl-ACP dehydrogenase [Bordetella sp. BOR01]